jgi:hypothetical protein
MAVNPNTDFTTGATLASTQMNRLPRGVMAYNESTSTDVTITAEEIQITLAAFTAVANRLYRLTYYEPGFGSSVAAAMTMRIRLTNLAGAIQQSGIVYNTGAQQQNGCVVGYTTFSAGSVVLVATLQNSAGTGSANRSSTNQAKLCVEDVGPI